LFARSRKRRYKERMSEPIIAQKFPFVQKAEPGEHWWCACGRSKSQPFCDGSHKGTGFAPVKTEIAEAKTVAWCGCKHSANKPFCDGSHSRLA
jgi:CDGSH-type Zn-finger protein